MTKKQTECVVCKKYFYSEYDERVRANPIYHPSLYNQKNYRCEYHFFACLMQMYKHLHKSQSSIQVPDFIRRFNWPAIAMKPEMVSWCLQKGFLALDVFKRVVVPPAVSDACNEVFSSYSLEDEENIEMATEYLRVSIAKHIDEFEPAEMEVPVMESDERLEQKSVIAKATQRRMATVDITGVGSSVDRRGMHSRSR